MVTNVVITSQYIQTKNQYVVQLKLQCYVSNHTSIKNCNWNVFFLSFVFLGVTSVAYGASRARGLIGDVAAGLCQNPSNAKSETRL